MTDLLGMAALALDEDVLAGFGLLSPAEQAEYLELIEQALEGLWVLTPKQQLAEELWGKVDWLLYGGSAAGGKSEFACHHANRLSTEIEGHSTLLIRQSIPELRRSLILRLLARGRQFRLPMRLRKVDGQTGFHYENGSLIECGYLATDEHVGNYLSAEYDAIIIDEATQLMPDHIVALSARLRTTKEKAKRGSRPHLGLFTNPGDVSHAFLYNLFVVPTDYGNEVVVFNVANGIERAFPVRSYRAPVPVREATFDEIDDILIPWAQSLVVECDPETELAVAFVPSKATDNPHIDRSYLKFLNALPDRRRRQLRDGDWDTFEGQFFEEWARDSHVINPFDIPEHWPRARAADYGSAAPWACYWGAWEPETGNCYVYRERYGAGLSPQQQGRAAKDASVIVRPDGSSVKETYFASVGDPSVFSNSRGQGKSIADLWREAGFTVSRAKNARVAGWANMRQYLWDHEKDNGDDLPAGGPRLFVFDTCPDLIRTMPLQQRDKDNPEDLNTKLEDHACVAPDTLVATRRGEVPISTVVSGDEVATRAGWRRVEWAGVTGVRPLVRLSLPDGGWLDCTEDHPVWTENRGWIAAGSVAHCDTLHALWTPLSSPPRSKNMLVSATTCAGSTSSTREAGFIEWSGNLSVVPSPKATTSIMSMGTGPTIGSPISNSWTAQITSAFTPPSARLLGLLPLNARFRVSSLETPDSPPSSEQKPPGSGGSPRSAIISSSARRAGAKCSRRFRHGPSSVGSTAARPQCELASVPLGYSSPVWNLLVEGEHEFYANGYLVHNCDAIRYLLALRPLQAGPSTRAPKTGQSLDQRFTFRLRQFDKKHRNRRQGWT